jgi:hypothetical protein
MKPLNLTKLTISTTKINDYLIKKLEIDLIHINYGLNRKKKNLIRSRDLILQSMML